MHPFHDPEWEAVLSRVGSTSAAYTAGLLLFLEEREDLSVTAVSGDEPVLLHSRLRGLSVRAPFRRSGAVHLVDPQPGDAGRLVRSALGDESELPKHLRSTAEAPSAIHALPAGEAKSLVSRAVEELARLRPGVTAVARWVGFEQLVQIGRPGRPVSRETRRSARLRLEATISGGGGEASAVAEKILIRGRTQDQADFPGLMEHVIPELAEEVAGRVVQRLGARRAPAGEVVIVLAPGIGGVLMHEIVGHALEADTVRNGSWLAASGGGTVASKKLTIVDDPRRGRAAWTIDDEGEEALATPLLLNGRVANWLHDQVSARRAGRKPTGHGRRASYRDPVQPRMGCTFVGAGTLKPEEVVGNTSEGIYVRRMESASINPLTGRAVFRVTDSDRIRNGGLCEPLMPFLLEVNARSTLSKVDLIADDLTFDSCIGSCHKSGQALVTSVGAPTMRIGLVKVIS